MNAEDRANMQQIGPKLQAKFDPELKKLLTPEQFTRLKQINWQYLRSFAFEEPEIIAALGLESDQQEQIADLRFETFKQQRELLNPPGGGQHLPPGDLQKKTEELKADEIKKVNLLLTTEQQKKFAELKGKPFDLSQLSSPAGEGGAAQKKTDEKKN